jgi:hypothetical protein
VGKLGGGRIIVLQDEIFGRQNLYCTRIINKLVAHKTCCQATKQTLPHLRGQETVEFCGWAKPLSSFSRKPFPGAPTQPASPSTSSLDPQLLSLACWGCTVFLHYFEV